jgi:hypothetical protein
MRNAPRLFAVDDAVTRNSNDRFWRKPDLF